DDYVAAGSTVTVLADVDRPEFPSLERIAVEFHSGDATNRALLDELDVATFDHIIVLSYRDGIDAQRSDSKTLITLLQLRDMAELSGIQLNIVSEMLDDRNRELAEVTDADDFIVSDQLISRIVSQVSENKTLIQVFDSLFSSTGSEIYLYPAEHYLTAGSTVNFYTVLEAARQRGETALGYRSAAHAHRADSGYGIVLNPTKGDAIAFAAGDQVIVLAEG
ncbi:MAG: NAD-binding protein, partial [Rhodoglobus sp.]